MFGYVENDLCGLVNEIWGFVFLFCGIFGVVSRLLVMILDFDWFCRLFLGYEWVWF